MKRVLLLLSLFCLLLTGCLPLASLHPFYSEDVLVTDANLIGTWAADDMVWEFARADDNAYTLTITEDDKFGVFSVHLFQMQGQLLMDFVPEELPKDLPLSDFYKLHLLPVHNLMKVNLTKTQLQMYLLDIDRLKQLLEAYPHLFHHEFIADEVILMTDTPQAAQTFVRTFADYKTLWSDEPVELKRP